MESMICTLLPALLETKARCGNPLVLWVGLAPLHPKQMASRAQRKEMAPNLKLGTLGSTWMIKGEKPNYSRAAVPELQRLVEAALNIEIAGAVYPRCRALALGRINGG